MLDIIKYNETTFENIKHIDDNGDEFWLARELQIVLEYTEWRNFGKVIEKRNQPAQEVTFLFLTILMTSTKWCISGQTQSVKLMI